MTPLCVDLGGTRLRAALLKVPCKAEPLRDWPAPADLETFRRRVGDLIDAHGVSRIGVAVPGLASGAVCGWTPNLPYLNGLDLARMFSGVTVALGNDARLALLAEAALGAARGASDVILLAIGTGIGSAVLADGRIVYGRAAPRLPSVGPAPTRRIPGTLASAGSNATPRGQRSTPSQCAPAGRTGAR